MKFECSMGFLDIADRMVWLHLCHVTGSDRIRWLMALDYNAILLIKNTHLLGTLVPQ